jgi:hypothetical protein
VLKAPTSSPGSDQQGQVKLLSSESLSQEKVQKWAGKLARAQHPGLCSNRKRSWVTAGQQARALTPPNTTVYSYTQVTETPHSSNEILDWRPRRKREKWLVVDKPDQSLDSLNREMFRLWEQQSYFWTTLCAQRSHYPPPTATSCTWNCPTSFLQLLWSEPSSQTTSGKSRALREPMSKCNRRTTDRNQRTRNCRGASSALINPSRHSVFSSFKERIMTFLFIYLFYFFIYMCIHCVGHFSPLSPPFLPLI